MADTVTTITSEMTDGQWSSVNLQWPQTAKIAVIEVCLSKAVALYMKLYGKHATTGVWTALTGTTNTTARTISNGTVITTIHYFDNTLQSTDAVQICFWNEVGCTTAYTGDLEYIKIHTWQKEKIGQRLELSYAGTGIPPWRYQTYVKGERDYITGITGVVSESVKARIYVDGETSNPNYEELTTANIQVPFAITGAEQASTLTLDFVATDSDTTNKDTSVSSVIIYAQEPELVSDGMIHITGHDNYHNRLFKIPGRGTPTVAQIGVHATTSDWAGTITLTKVDDGTSWSYALSGYTQAQNQAVIPITNSTAATLWNVDLTITEGIPIDLIVGFKRTKQVEGNYLKVEGTDIGISEWLLTRYDFGRTVTVAGFMVESDATSVSTITMGAYKNGSLAESIRKIVTITSDRERIPTEFSGGGLGEFRTLDFRFSDTNGATDHRVRAVHIWLEEDIPATQGIHAYSPEHTRGLVLASPTPIPLTAIMVDADAYNGATGLPLVVTVDGAALSTPLSNVTSNGLIIPVYNSGRRFTVSLDTNDGTASAAPVDVRQFHVWFRTGPPKDAGKGPLHETTVEGSIPPWLSSVYSFAPGTKIVSFIVHSRTYTALNMNLYINGSATRDANSPTSIADSAEYTFHADIRSQEIRTLAIDFGGKDASVDGFWISTPDVMPITVAGLIIRDGASRIFWRNIVLQFEKTGSLDAWRAVLDVYTGSPTIALTPLNGNIGLTATAIASDLDQFLATTMTNCREWALDVVRPAGTVVRELHLYGRRDMELKSGAAVFPQEAGGATTLTYVIRADRPWNPACVRVLASSYSTEPILTVYHEGTVVVSARVVPNDTIKYLPVIRPERVFQFKVVVPETIIVHEFAAATNPGNLT